MEQDVVMLGRPSFIDRYVGNSFVREKNEADKIFNSLNSYHKNMKLTIKTNPTKFIWYIIKTQIYIMDKKFPVE